ncbi:MAG: murein transglycosylase [Ignavibacteriae bacterium]|nr:MAG: murein transglycosylase [Ignavibacteriota bacterium]
MKKNKIILSSFTILLVLLTVFLLSSFSTSNNTFNKKRSDGSEITYSLPKIPKELNFCGEVVPTYNFDVHERLEREFIVNTYWHSLTILTLQRANRWFPIIEPILEKYDIPNDFKYLAITESTLLNITSPAGAVGYWQFMKSAARDYNLEVNQEIDERYNIEKATEAACKYLLKAYEKYNSWTMAAASYNFGMNGIDRQIERQETNNYYNLVLGEETSRYVFRVIATKVILENPEDYGFFIEEEELHEPLETFEVQVDSSVKSWAEFAKSFGYNYKILKFYNPWLRENYLTNKKKKTYKIKFPVEGSIKVVPELQKKF